MQYIVRLAPAAERFFRTLEPFDQQGLDRALAEELIDGPNADKEIRFDADGGSPVYSDPDLPGDVTYYIATPLSFKAYTAIHRPMTMDELSRTAEGKSNLASDHGFYVFDILPAESAFMRRTAGPDEWSGQDPPPRR
jgi:hypothetical protein